MKVEDVLFSEHLAFHSDLDLEALCGQLEKYLMLPHFEFDAENETAWGLVNFDFLELNVTVPYDVGTLQKWDSTVPDGCNVGITISVLRQHPTCTGPEWSFHNLVPQYAGKIANCLGSTVYYHRTWLGPNQNIQRKGKYMPTNISARSGRFLLN